MEISAGHIASLLVTYSLWCHSQPLLSCSEKMPKEKGCMQWTAPELLNASSTLLAIAQCEEFTLQEDAEGGNPAWQPQAEGETIQLLFLQDTIQTTDYSSCFWFKMLGGDRDAVVGMKNIFLNLLFQAAQRSCDCPPLEVLKTMGWGCGQPSWQAAVLPTAERQD